VSSASTRPQLCELTADWRSAPLGAYAPTSAQRAVIAAAQALARIHVTFRNRAIRWTQAMRPGPIDAELVGLTLRFCPHLNFRDGAALFAEPVFDARERAFLVEHLPQGGVFLDIGASMGIYTLTVAARRPDVRVIAFEPIADVADRLSFNLAANKMSGRVEARALALGDTTGMLAFNREAESAVLGEGTVSVPCDTLLNAARAEGLTRIDAIKIDVEGYEDRVLFPFFAEAPETLWPRHVIIEHILPDAWERNPIDLLASHHYKTVWRGGFNTIYER
jgi:FkbM family methyltransferase